MHSKPLVHRVSDYDDPTTSTTRHAHGKAPARRGTVNP